MTVEEIIAIMDSFRFDKMNAGEKKEFIEQMFSIIISSLEISSILSRRKEVAKKDLAELIRIRLIQDENCPACDGYGGECSTCYGTGKRNIYRE